VKIKIEDRGNGTTWAEIGNSKYTNMNEIARWCNTHQCGKRVNLQAFSFKNQEEITMFLLRWQGEKN
jgi:hypothetical protein